SPCRARSAASSSTRPRLCARTAVAGFRAWWWGGGRRGNESREWVVPVGVENGLPCACKFYTHVLANHTCPPGNQPRLSLKTSRKLLYFNNLCLWRQPANPQGKLVGCLLRIRPQDLACDCTTPLLTVTGFHPTHKAAASALAGASGVTSTASSL